MRTETFDYRLPNELIAQHPKRERDESRLMVIDRKKGEAEDKKFREVIEYLNPGDIIVLNNSKVIPARLRGEKAGGGGAKIEILLIEEKDPSTWWSMIRPGKRCPIGVEIQIITTHGTHSGIVGKVVDKNAEGHALLKFYNSGGEVKNSEKVNLLDILEAKPIGETPLPPYIDREWDPKEDPKVYQTVYAKRRGSVAAPTAGLHWTSELLEKIKRKGVEIVYVTLHVGAGTFAPVKTASIEEHIIHKETYEITESAALALTKALNSKKRIIAVGTTSLRVLESAVKKEDHNLKFCPERSSTQLYVYPPYNFQVVSGLITNFHLPQSTLLMLVSAFISPGEKSGINKMKKHYQEAIDKKYHFFSYGDAMIII